MEKVDYKQEQTKIEIGKQDGGGRRMAEYD
jgi:hypothetical protein